MTGTDETGAGSTLDSAVRYLRGGRHVLPLHSPSAAGCSCGNPCDSPGKHPRAGIGIKHASRDEGVVRGWLDYWPDTNIGVRTDGLFVFDVDGAVGGAALERLQSRLGVLPRTRTHSSRPDHRHLLFTVPDGFPSSNSKRGLGSPAGVDVRGGTAGYLVAPPSRHAAGGRYRVVDDHPLTLLPAAWLRQVHSPRLKATSEAARPSLETLICADDTPYGLAALRSESLEVRAHPVGGRREQLNRSSFRLGQLAAGGELSQQSVFEAMVAAGLSHGFELHTVAGIVNGAVDAGLRFPRRR